MRSNASPVPQVQRLGSPAQWTVVMAAVFAAAIAYDLLRMPVQVHDAALEILTASRSESAWALAKDALGSSAYLRPLRLAQIKVLFDLSQGHYWAMYRGFHALLVCVGIGLFVRALRVRDWQGFAAAVVALTVLTGVHTFRGLVQEAFPINHFLEVVVCCLLTFTLAQSRGGRCVDAVAALTFAVASLTLESGLLVWVVAAAAYLCGLRGISRGGLAAMTVLLAAYLAVRFALLSTGVPGLEERSSGFWLETLDPAELERRFGANPFAFYGYNVLVSALSVLVSEPRAGVFVAARAWLDGTLQAHAVIAVATSSVTTGLIVFAVARAIRRRELDEPARLACIFLAVLAANAAISFAYTKDEIMTPAGVFYALAAYAAIRDLLVRSPGLKGVGAIVLTSVLVVTASGWAIRSAGIHQILRTQAFNHRNDWALLPVQWRAQGLWPVEISEQVVLERLREDAIALPVPNPHFDRVWVSRLVGDR